MSPDPDDLVDKACRQHIPKKVVYTFAEVNSLVQVINSSELPVDELQDCSRELTRDGIPVYIESDSESLD